MEVASKFVGGLRTSAKVGNGAIRPEMTGRRRLLSDRKPGRGGVMKTVEI